MKYTYRMKLFFNYLFEWLSKFISYKENDSIWNRVNLFFKYYGISNIIGIEKFSSKNNTGINNLSNLDNLVNEDNNSNMMNINSINKITGGYKSYKLVTIFKDVIFSYNADLQMITIDKEGLYNNIVNFLSKLDRNKTYTALFIAESWNYNRIVGTLSEHSILIHKDLEAKVLAEIIEIDINKFMSKYLNNKYDNIVDFKISVQYREWLDENKYGKDKFLQIKELINKNSLKNLRKLTSLNKIISEDVNIINGLKYMNFFDFNLPYNYWFEIELFFKNIIKNNLINFNKDKDKDNSIDLDGEDIIKLYKILLESLKDNY